MMMRMIMLYSLEYPVIHLLISKIPPLTAMADPLVRGFLQGRPTRAPGRP